MTLAPIRGAPPGAPVPDFPAQASSAAPAPPAEPAPPDPPQQAVRRARGMPLEIGGSGVTLTFTVIPELPAIQRASVMVHVVAIADVPLPPNLGFLRMSAAHARKFLTDLRDGRSPAVAGGDEDGTLQINFTDAPGWMFSIHRPGEPRALHRGVILPTFDLTLAADELLAELGA